MHTLHDHMIATKAAEYIMEAGFLVLFLLFWRFLCGHPKRSDAHRRP